jgi:hypothetical protein
MVEGGRPSAADERGTARVGTGDIRNRTVIPGVRTIVAFAT